MHIKSIRDVKDLAGKRVILRADFNVPIEDGKIKEGLDPSLVNPAEIEEKKVESEVDPSLTEDNAKATH